MRTSSPSRLALALLSLFPLGATAAELTSEEVEFFEKKIRPVLAESCYECHNSVDKAKGDLALDWRKPLMESGVIVPGKPEESGLIKAIRHAEDYEPMPDKAPKLSKLTIKSFEDWIRMGAPDPRATKPTKEELSDGLALIEATGDTETGLADLRWALFNCHEFRYLP